MPLMSYGLWGAVRDIEKESIKKPALTFAKPVLNHFEETYGSMAKNSPSVIS